MSTISSTSIIAVGTTSSPGGGPCTGIMGASRLTVTFTIADVTPYTFGFQCGGNYVSQVSLIGPQTNVVYNAATMGTTPQSVSGVMQPGSYTLQAIGNASYDHGTLQPGNWNINLTVSQPDGACCSGASCAITSPSQCSSMFVSGTACNVPGNNVTPCCRVNVNQVSGVTVQDIFDFLAGWFAGNVNIGNFNGDCCVSTQDIFDFLAAWFQGC